MKRRKWCYVMPPQDYSIQCDLCGGTNIFWSEFEHMIWCYDCKKDTSGTGGIFDGPIPWMVTKITGISFARHYLKENVIRYPTFRGHKIVYTKKRPEGETEYTLQKRTNGRF